MNQNFNDNPVLFCLKSHTRVCVHMHVGGAMQITVNVFHTITLINIKR